MKSSNRYFAAAGLILLFATGLGVRRAVLEAQFPAARGSLPFTLESALNFRRIEEVFDAGRLPAVDLDLEYPLGVVVRENDTVGAEYVYAALARLFPRSIPLADRIRWIESAWFCLGIPLVALWLWWWRRSAWGAAIAGGFYAVGLSSVMRSTGQEISHENFALPLLIGHLAFGALSDTAPRASVRWLAAVTSAVLLGLALATWDLVQFYILLWMVVSLVRLLRGTLADDGWERTRWLMSWLAVVAVGWFNPYFRSHAFLLSPPMLLSYGLLAAAVVRGVVARGSLAPSWGRPGALLGIALLPVVLGWVLPTSFHDSYGHFSELLWAKIRFLNRKPDDPARLTFDQRIMWVPALHSANWALTRMLFPAMLWLNLAAVLVLLHRPNDRTGSRITQLLFFFLASLAAFVLLVRFHVFLAIFSAGVLGAWAAGAAVRRGWLRWVVLTILLAGMGAEAAHTLTRPERWGRTQVYYDELDDLVRWLGTHVVAEPVLANFGVSASILAYGKCPIILHPKFESREMRQRVRGYGEALFKGTEADLRDWADDRGARYYVYALGEFASFGVEQQMRYFVDALEPASNCAARVLETEPDQGMYFRYLWGNRKYRVFKILTRAEEGLAGRYSSEAQGALDRGELDRAEEKAISALLLDPRNQRAQDVVKHVGSLKDQGFKYSRHEPE
ncbi:MAG: hypothetical protein V1873_01425 [Verrucomicrobiota bacterium]